MYTDRMRFPTHWARGSAEFIDVSGTSHVYSCWRSSDQSVGDAQQRADVGAKALVERAQRDEPLPDRYGYDDRAMREPVLQRFDRADGNMFAAITRNAHGCDVLNTAHAMFIDINVPGIDHTSPFDKLRRWMGARGPEAKTLDAVRQWVATRPDWGVRVYRTRAGFRLLATHATFDPRSAEVHSSFAALGADPLYVRLCKTQQCFRARLTPKPWRIGVKSPRQRWPFADAQQQSQFDTWHANYKAAASKYATCSLVEVLGHPKVHHEIEPLVRLHDEATGVATTLPLA